MLANIYRDRKKKPAPFKPQDFMPYSGDESIDDARLAAKIMATNAALGGTTRIH